MMKKLSAVSATGARALARLALAATILTGLMTATTASAAPFSDGSFEIPASGSNQNIGTGGTIGAWTVVRDNVDIVRTSYTAADGNQSVDLEGTAGASGAICQSFDTLVGTQYNVNFAMSHNGFSGNTTATMGVFIDGSSIGTFAHNNPAWTAANPAWEPHTAPFTATSTVTSLCFVDSASGVSGFGPAIDAVTLSVPPQNACTAAQTIATKRNWFFGTRVVLDFGVTGNPPIASQNPVNNNVPEGTAVITDTSGNLLFWTDGTVVRDRNSNVMPNGTGIGGSPSSTQTALAFPSLTQPGIYFVIGNSTVTTNPGSLFYSVVDMNQNGGLGVVTATKGVLLGAVNTASEALNAAPNADGTGFYVMTSTINSSKVLAYEFDGNGPVTGTAIVSVLPTPNNGNGFGTLNISPNLSQLVLATGGRVRLLDFDASSGQVTQKLSFVPAGGGSMYSAEFSPSGNYLYYTGIFSGARLFRYNLVGAASGAAVLATQENLGPPVGSGGRVARGPDGKMYVANVGQASVGVVNLPEDPVSPNYVNNGLPLASGSASQFGLPTFVTGCPITAMADLSVTKTTSSPTYPGTNITFTIKVQNNGPDASSGYTVVDNVPASITNVASSTPGCSVVGNTVTCTSGTLANGGIDTITITGKTPTNAPTTVGNTVTLTGNDIDPTPGNNTSTSTSMVDYPPGLCRGTPIGLLGKALVFGVANGPTTPCVTATNTVLNINQPIGDPPSLLSPLGSSVKSTVITGTSTKSFGTAAATANIAKVDIVAVALVTVSAVGVESEAKSQAVSGCSVVTTTGKSKIASLKVNGLTVVVGSAPLSVPLLIGGLYLNQTVVSGNTVTQRALFLDLPGTLLDVVVGETVAGLGC